MRSIQKKHLTRALTICVGGFLTMAAGLACLRYSFAEPLARLSYDLPFIWRATLDTSEVSLVYLDDESAKQLHQPLSEAWNRALHAQLLDRLTKDQTRLVFYDIVFDSSSPDPAQDEAFADSIRRHGKVILGAALETAGPVSTVKQERVVPPIKLLRKAAAGWGLLAFRPIDPDYGVRQIFSGTAEIASATWKAAEALEEKMAQVPRETRPPRWINYYGPANTFASVNVAQALEPEGVPPGYFANKIVFVGGRSALGNLGTQRDEFATPYSRSNHGFTPGLEVHATVLLNLLRGEWLTRLPSNWEAAIIVFIGLIAAGLSILRPQVATLFAVFASLVIAALAWWFVWNHRVWCNWLVPSAIQLPLGLAWSVGTQYLLESRRRKELRKAFGFYLSPQMAEKISQSDFDLKPGGKVVEATIMFTDLEGFTSFAENLDPAEVSKILIAYFEQTTRCILENKGTIIKYMGDAVQAGWGAPVDEPEHAMLAAQAACSLRCLAELDLHGRKLRTRIGVHSGKVLAGNLGSSYRFDYAMIGDTTNFASRLESLNKLLGTQVLISDAVKERVGDKIVTRRIGNFRVAGKSQSVVIHELICRADAESGERQWIKIFEEGLEIFCTGDFEKARRLMNRTREVRGGFDGPAEFYSNKMEMMEAKGLPQNWTGVIELSEK